MPVARSILFHKVTFQLENHFFHQLSVMYLLSFFDLRNLLHMTYMIIY